MRSSRCIAPVIALAIITASCARIDDRVSYPEELIGSAREDAPRRSAFIATASAAGDGITIAVVEQVSCVTEVVESYRTYELVERTERGHIIAGEYAYAAIGLVAGAIFFAIAGDYPDEPPPGEPGAFTQSKANGLGAAFAVTGAISLTAAVWDSFALRDTRRSGGEVERRPEHLRESAPCDRRPVAIAVELVADGRESVSLGTTGADGSLHVGWSAVPAAWVRGAKPVAEAQIAAGDGASEPFSIDAARAYWAAARVSELRVELDNALAERDPARGRRAVAELKALLGATDEVVGYYERINAIAREQLRAAIDAALSQPFADVAVADTVNAAIDELELAGGEAKVVQRYRAEVARRMSKLQR